MYYNNNIGYDYMVNEWIDVYNNFLYNMQSYQCILQNLLDKFNLSYSHTVKVLSRVHRNNNNSFSVTS